MKLDTQGSKGNGPGSFWEEHPELACLVLVIGGGLLCMAFRKGLEWLGVL